MEKIYLTLEIVDGYPPVSTESVWAKKTSKDTYIIKNIPFYSKNVSLEDEVNIKLNDDGLFLYKKTAKKSGNSTIRVIFFDYNEKIDYILQELVKIKVFYEGFNDLFYALNIPKEVSIHKIYKILDNYIEEGLLDYDTGLLTQ